MAASAMPRHHLAVLLALLLALASPAATRQASAACASEKFPAGRAYAACEDLPKLGASLHWTYDASKSSLSVAFVAAPAATNGWVAWGLNPTGDGMAGAQALVALKGSSGSGALTVKTYNISGYGLGASSPLEFPATDLAADAGGSGGKFRVYGKLQLPEGMKAVNQVWQVGSSVTGGTPDKHAFGADNLSAKSKLVLAGSKAAAPSLSPVSAPEAGGPSASGSGTDSGAAASAMAPSAGKSPNAAALTAAGVSAPALLMMALVVGFLVTV